MLILMTANIKHTLITSAICVVIVALALAGYSYISRPNTAGNVGPDSTTPQPSATRIVAVGDIVCSPLRANAPGDCNHQATLNIAQQLKPDAVLLLGDLQYDDGSLATYQSAFAPTWGTFGDKLHPAPGNHEYNTAGASGYYDYFGAQAGERGKGYYSFDLGKWHIVALNSNCSAVGGCGESSPQGQWLKSDLTANQAACTLAFWHHPAFSSGRYSGKTDQLQLGASFWPSLIAAKADVVLNGHDHLYERFAQLNATGQPNPTGIRQFTVGTGGRSLYKITNPLAGSEKRIDTTYGVLALDLFGKAYHWKFVGIDGSVLDQGSGLCIE